MTDFRRYLPTVWYFGKFFLLAVSGFFAFILYLSLRYFSWFPLWPVVRGVFTAFSTEGFIYLILTIGLIAAIAVTVVRFMIPLYFIHKVHEHNAEVCDNFRVITYEGELGAGKTLAMTYDSVILSDYVFREKYFDYLLQYGKEKGEDITPFKNEQEAARFNALKESVEYYFRHPEKIPLLVSSYPIKRGDQMSSVLTFEHFMQQSRLPEGAVIAQDESADILSNRRSVASGKRQGRTERETEENEVINETLSKQRHHYDSRSFFAEQDSAENFIGLRRVVNVNRYLVKLRKVCVPDGLIRRLNKLKDVVLDKAPYLPHDDFKADSQWDEYQSGACTYAQYLKAAKLKARIKKIGFFVIDYIQKGNKDKGNDDKRESFFVLPMNLDFEYETRGYFFQNNALNLLFDLETHDNMYVRPKETPDEW